MTRNRLFSAALAYLEKKTSCDTFLEELKRLKGTLNEKRESSAKVIVLEAEKRARNEIRKRDGLED